MDQEVLLIRVKDRLEKMGVDFDSLDKNVQKSLLKIEKEVFHRFDELSSAIETINSNRININTISKSGAISNKTVYKHEILLQYIKSCEEEYSCSLPGGKNTVKALRDKLSDASETIKRMNLQTVDVELLKVEIDQLKADALDDASKIASLTEENLRLTKEIQLLRKNNPELFEERKDTIIAMPGITMH